MLPGFKEKMREKYQHREQEIELRMKVYCGAEIEGKTLEVFIESLNG